MTPSRIRGAVWVLFATAAAASAFAQDGSDINTAIQIYFDQVVTGIGERGTFTVYSITLAKGQTINMGLSPRKEGAAGVGLAVYNSQALTVRSAPESSRVFDTACCSRSVSGTYLVPTSGTYYLVAMTYDDTVEYQLAVKSTGTPISIPNPATAGCLTGSVDYITYSLQRIAAGLPDEVSIGGSVACASCAVKPPAHLEIASRLEGALKSNISVSACYHSSGNMFQVKMMRP